MAANEVKSRDSPLTSFIVDKIDYQTVTVSVDENEGSISIDELDQFRYFYMERTRNTEDLLSTEQRERRSEIGTLVGRVLTKPGTSSSHDT